MKVKDFLARLEGVRKTSGGWMALCPAHGDEHASLSVREGEGGRILVRCFAGCNAEQIMGALGLSLRALFNDGGDKVIYQVEKPRKGAGVAKRAARILEEAMPASPDHPYLRIKSVKPYGIKQRGKVLVIPLLDWQGDVFGLQWIRPDGSKRFLSGSEVSGHFFKIDGDEDRIFIVEGYATGASVHEATGATVICAFNCGNLLSVAKAVRRANTGTKIILCADNDQWTQGNPGLTKATEAARAVGGLLAIPQFRDTSARPTDFSDLHQQEGLDVVKRTLSTAKPLTGLKLTPLSEIEAEQIEWLWEPYLPQGKIVLLEGDPGIGKTWVALAICAKLVGKGHIVVYASCEDGTADTLKPRVQGMEPRLDLDRFLILEGKQGKNGITDVFTLKDISLLEQTIRAYRPSLVVLDPIQGFVGADVDMHRANEVRARLARVVRLAEKYGCTFVLVRHLAKGKTERAIYRGLGSIDFSAVARSILLVGEKGGQKVMAHVKSSLREKGPSLAFEIIEGKFFWAGEVELDAADLLEPEERRQHKAKLEEAKEFLFETLFRGPVRQEEIKKQAKSLGISEKTLRRAKDRLGIKSRPDRDEEGKIRGWLWELPPDCQPATRPLKAIDGHLDRTPETRMDTALHPDAHTRSRGHVDKGEKYQSVTQPKPDGQVRPLGDSPLNGHLDMPKEARFPKPSECRACHGNEFWLSEYGTWVCRTCHPPQDDNMGDSIEIQDASMS